MKYILSDKIKILTKCWLQVLDLHFEWRKGSPETPARMDSVSSYLPSPFCEVEMLIPILGDQRPSQCSPIVELANWKHVSTRILPPQIHVPKLQRIYPALQPQGQSPHDSNIHQHCHHQDTSEGYHPTKLEMPLVRPIVVHIAKYDDIDG